MANKPTSRCRRRRRAFINNSRREGRAESNRGATALSCSSLLPFGLAERTFGSHCSPLSVLQRHLLQLISCGWLAGHDAAQSGAGKTLWLQLQLWLRLRLRSAAAAAQFACANQTRRRTHTVVHSWPAADDRAGTASQPAGQTDTIRLAWRAKMGRAGWRASERRHNGDDKSEGANLRRNWPYFARTQQWAK